MITIFYTDDKIVGVSNSKECSALTKNKFSPVKIWKYGDASIAVAHFDVVEIYRNNKIINRRISIHTEYHTDLDKKRQISFPVFAQMMSLFKIGIYSAGILYSPSNFKNRVKFKKINLKQGINSV